MTQSSSRSRRKLRSYHKSPTAPKVNSGLKADREGCEPKPLSFQDIDNGLTVQALERIPSQSYHPAEPATHTRRRDSLTHHSNRVVRIFSSKTPLARHWRVLSRHIRRFQNSEAHDGGRSRPGDSQEMISLTQIPSIMDVYLDAKSPSIDYTEEVFLEIADRSRRLSLLNSGYALASSHSVPYYSSHHYHREYRLSDSSDSLSSEVSALNHYRKEQICHGGNDAHSGNSVTRHPDSFVRSTATWSEGLPNEQ